MFATKNFKITKEKQGPDQILNVTQRVAVEVIINADFAEAPRTLGPC